VPDARNPAQAVARQQLRFAIADDGAAASLQTMQLFLRTST
jgi:hypothetical protein